MTNSDDYTVLAERLTRLEAQIGELVTRVTSNETATYDFCVAMKRDTTALVAQVAGLQKQVTELEEDGPRAVQAVLDYVKVVSENVQMLGRDQTDILERLQNVELKFFPHLRKDMSHLHNIIGDSTDTADNPLDRRTP